jgi:putative addiction module killer protein
MYEIRKTDAFVRWLDNLADRRGRAKILARLDRIAEGNLGDTKPIGQGVAELRIPFGPGYRVYYTKRLNIVVILLLGGDKSSQAKDIKRAIQMAQDLEE